WFANKTALDEFMQSEEAKCGRELEVTEDLPIEGETPEPTAEDNGIELQVIDMHEMRTINEVLEQLKRDYGISIHDLIPAGNRNGEPYYPFVIQGADEASLSSLRDLVMTLSKLGEKGLVLTRFKGLGEMD